MLGSSSTIYNEQPTSAEMLPSRARTEIGYEANIQQFDQNPTYKRVCRAHPHTYGKTPTGGNRHECISAHPRAYGKIVSLSFCHTSCTAHPRAYGENPEIFSAPKLRMGSSPRIRGKRPPEYPPGARKGLIPAHTGKTGCFCRSGRRRGAHPRAYGENAEALPFCSVPSGSSPRIRGTRLRRILSDIHLRLIPTHYGEHRLEVRSELMLIGSPPRIRGKQHTGRWCQPPPPPSTFTTPARAPLGGPPPPRRQAAPAR